jgi:hypothetical protein
MYFMSLHKPSWGKFCCSWVKTRTRLRLGKMLETPRGFLCPLITNALSIGSLSFVIITASPLSFSFSFGLLTVPKSFFETLFKKGIDCSHPFVEVFLKSTLWMLGYDMKSQILTTLASCRIPGKYQSKIRSWRSATDDGHIISPSSTGLKYLERRMSASE